MRKDHCIILTGTLLIVSACANIEPRDRNFLAKPQMQAEPNRTLSDFTEHVYFSREAIAGGNGVGGGGCGCN